MSTVTCPVQLSCDDGVFPTVANVVGLLTFAYAIAAGLLVYYRSFRNVSRDVETILWNNRSSHLGALALPSDFWSIEKIRSTIEGNQLLGIQREASQAACDHINGLGEHARQFLKGYGRSVGFRDRLRFMSSQQDVAEKTVSVNRALETLKAIDIRYEKFAESLHREHQDQALEAQQKLLEEIRSRQKVLEQGLQLTGLDGVSAMEPIIAKPRALQSHWC